jgi:oligosaccharide reducing-end xylanase
MCKTASLRAAVAGLLALWVVSCTAPEKHNAVESGSALTGEYQNLFAEAGYADREIEEKIESAFQQLFYGDPESQAVYYPAGENDQGPLAYILDVHNNDVRSEGMSYGMMIAVQMDRKQEFDAIWNWSKTYMYHDNPEHPAKGYFAWSVLG